MNHSHAPSGGRAAGRAFVRAASVLGSLTLASRVLGYVRDSLNAALFGAGWVADAYFVAFRIPNLLRDLVGEGALSAAVVPTASRLAAGRGGRREAGRLISALLTWAGAGGVLVVAAGFLAAPPIVHVMAPGFLSLPAKFALTVSLTRWLFPFIVCISLAAIVQGWLVSREVFGPTALAPVALNASIIAGGLVLCPLFGDAPERRIYGWTIGVLLGGLAQWLVQVPAARRTGWRSEVRWRHPALGEVGRLMVPALIGFSITQVHLLVNTILASLLPEGSVARLYYGNRLMQLPLGVVGVALSTAAYPAVARALAGRRAADAAAPLNRALRLLAFTVLPASAGLIALGPQINGLLFRFGRFTAFDASVTAAVSSAYAIGIAGHAAIRVLTPPFYAAGRPYVPVWVAGVGVVCNALLSSVLMQTMGVVGLPLATSAVALGSAVWLLVRLRAIVPGLGGGAVVRTCGGSLLAAGAMGVVVALVAHAGEAGVAAAALAPKAREAILTAGGMTAGVGVYALLARLLRLRELDDVLDLARR